MLLNVLSIMFFQYFSHRILDARPDVLARYHTYGLAEFIVWTLVCFFDAAQNVLPAAEYRDGRMRETRGGGVLFQLPVVALSVLSGLSI